MTDSSEEVPEVIRNLLHPTKELRKQALNYLKENWQKRFREYLWLAIEEEDSKTLQANFVETAIRKLDDDHGLRKMIRFVENGILYPGSQNNFIDGYCLYENEKVRTALIKSLKRRNTKTHEWVAKLLLSRSFIYRFEGNWGDNHQNWSQSKKQKDFLTDITGEDIPDKMRELFGLVTFWRSMKSERYAFSTQYLWNKVIRKDLIIQRHILMVFYNNQYLGTYRTSYTKKIDKIKLCWENWVWTTRKSSNKAMIEIFNELQTYLGMHEEIVFDSISSRDFRTRQIAIDILSNQYIVKNNPSTRNYDLSYYENFNNAWGLVYTNKIAEELLFLEYFNTEELIHVFSDDPSEYDEQNIPPLLEKYRVWNIHPELVVEAILAYRPRSYLTKMIVDDPHPQNRLLAYQSLVEKKFWFNDIPIGPPELWHDVIRQALRSIQFEDDIEIIKGAKDLIYFLIELLEDQSKFTSKFSSMLVNLMSKENSPILYELSAIEEKEEAQSIKLKLRNFLFDEPLTIEEGMNIGSNDRLVIDLLDKISESSDVQTEKPIIEIELSASEKDYLNSILNLFNSTDQGVRKQIVEYFHNRLENEPDFVMNKHRKLILSIILENAVDSDDIQTRTLAQLLAKKANISFIPVLLRDLNIRNIEILYSIFSVGHAQTNKKMFDQLLKRVHSRRKLNLSDETIVVLKELLEKGFRDKDMKIQKLASKIAEKLKINVYNSTYQK